MNDKSVLVINTPKSCVECLAYRHPQYCDANYYAHKKPYETAKYGIDIPNWCPLRPLPEKKELIEIDEKWRDEAKELAEVSNICKSSWNDCLKEITGETE
ncbi:MAG: hypothetical protein IKO38_07230 [Erysipelotrichaceae bacterium]|nr:hypothetical protein [Erysipelotrichaceae bacterium]